MILYDTVGQYRCGVVGRVFVPPFFCLKTKRYINWTFNYMKEGDLKVKLLLVFHSYPVRKVCKKLNSTFMIRFRTPFLRAYTKA